MKVHITILDPKGLAVDHKTYQLGKNYVIEIQVT